MALAVTFSPKQRAAIQSAADIVFFGGGNGPGKTFTLSMLPMLPEYRCTPGCQSVLFAESNTKLEQAGGLVDKTKRDYARAHPLGADGYRQTPRKRWTFPCPNGGESTIDLSYIGEPGQWDGMEAAVIGVDQIEQADERQVFALFGRNRSTARVRCRIFATANPPEEGKEHWLTKLLTAGGWIGDDGFPRLDMAGRVRFYTRDNDTDEFLFADTIDELIATGHVPRDVDGTPIRPQSVSFFPALIDDHPDETFRREYKSKLASLTLFERRRRLEGNWYVTESAGKYFRREHFPLVDDYRPSPGARLVRSWDNAWSTTEKADWTPGVLLSIEPDGGIYVLDVLRLRGTMAHVERAIDLCAALDGRQVQIRLPKDAGAAGGIQSAIAQRLGAKGYTVALTADRGDKLTRSKPYQACAERGQIRLVRRSHPSWQVAAMLCDDFEEHDKHGQIVRVQGLDVSAVSTRNGWMEGFVEEHVRFGRDTVNKRSVKKDTVDAAVGGYELLTNSDEPQPLTVEQATASAVGFGAIARTVHRGFALRSRGIS